MWGAAYLVAKRKKKQTKKCERLKQLNVFALLLRSIVASSPENVIDRRYGAYTVRAAGAARPTQSIEFVRKSFS